MSSRLKFTVQHKTENSRARACSFTTLHNNVLTPIFMPVATFASLRTQDNFLPDKTGFGVLLANTYHLLLRPGTEVFERIGGIHKFMNWKRSILTDSGGFQIFSLSESFKISDEGARFKSYVDGKEHLLNPENCIQTQKIIGSDIMMALDQCISSKSDKSLCLESIERTARWAERSIAARGDSPQSIFGIVQGACFPELRKISARHITSLPFDGFAIGGLAVGETADERKDITELTAALLPENMPRYLMGVGTPLDLLEAVHRGVDMFDCIIPTMMAQQGTAFTSTGRIEMRRGVFKFDERPIDETCDCDACANYSRAYIHHLIKTGEYYGPNLIGRHNLKFYYNLMNSMRQHIINGTFYQFYCEQKELLSRVDDEFPKVQTQAKYRKDTRRLGVYEIIQQKDFHSIRHSSSGEVMHSVSEPLTEARALYVDQACLEEKLTENTDKDFVMWDVGLGAGTNAMATIQHIEEIHKKNMSARKVRIISFENDLDSIRLAIMNPNLFTHVRHAAPSAIAKCGRWVSPDSLIEWNLLEGDFGKLMESAPPADCIFYDMYSINTNSEFWRYEFFCRLLKLCSANGAKLLTYSVSTQVRSALLSAGFFVAKGAPTGPKSETTIAYSKESVIDKKSDLLGIEWLEKWKRSTAKFYAESPETEKREIEQKVLNHPQFSGIK